MPQLGGRTTWWAEARNVVKMFYNAQGSPTVKKDPTPNVNSTKVEKPRGMLTVSPSKAGVGEIVYA